MSYQGGESFRISQGDLALQINPTNKRFKSDISLYTSGMHAEDEGPFSIAGPGEYEVKDITVKGFLSEGPKEKLNTLYAINFENMNLCFLGALANPALTSETLESLEDIDILFVPVGGEGVLDPAAAYKLAVSLEPKLIVPMSYSDATLKQFKKEGGEKNGSDPLDKLVVKKKDLEGKEGEIIVLKQE